MPYVDDQAHGYDRDHDQGGDGAKSGHERQHVVGVRHQDGREHAGRGDDHAQCYPDVPGRWRQGGNAGREVSGERG
jgi:hypothetical protein